jgi:hypothetical protein
MSFKKRTAGNKNARIKGARDSDDVRITLMKLRIF